MLRRSAPLAMVLALCLPSPAHASGVAIYAHRGGAALAPENTMGAFANAEQIFTAHGVDGWLEMDTQLTSDGVAVIIHDDSLDRTTDCTGTVNAKTLAQIAGCNAAAHFPGWGSFEPVPTAEQVFAAGLQSSPAWGIMIEIKDIPGEANFDPAGTQTAGALATLIHRIAYPLDRLIVESFWPPALDAIKTLVPGVTTLLLTTSQLPGAPPGAGFTLSENAVFAATRGYEISSPDEATVDLTAPVVEVAHALGRRVVVWTVDTPDDVERVIGTGADGIITNNPLLLL